MEISEDVQRGADKLDEVLPDWWTEDKIDLEKLNIDSVLSCVLGQLAGPLQAHGYGSPYADAFHEVFPYTTTPYGAVAREHGFHPDGPHSSDRLTVEWKHVIRERRELAAA